MWMMGLDFETSPFNEQNIGVKNDHASSYTNTYKQRILWVENISICHSNFFYIKM